MRIVTWHMNHWPRSLEARTSAWEQGLRRVRRWKPALDEEMVVVGVEGVDWKVIRSDPFGFVATEPCFSDTAFLAQRRALWAPCSTRSLWWSCRMASFAVGVATTIVGGWEPVGNVRHG